VSWLSVALHGRLTGSGAVFSGQQDDPFATLADGAAKAKADAIAAAKKAGGQVVQAGVSTASPGAVIVTPTMMAIGAVAVVGAIVLARKKG
jgi:hypothetical protein